MSNAIDLGFVGAGSRAGTHIRSLYAVRDESHAGRAAADPLLANPQPIYDEYAADPPSWVESAADLSPAVTAVFDPDGDARERAAERCREHGDDPLLYDSFESFLDEGAFDAVVVASPNHTHVDVVLPLLERGIDAFCEKPLATTLEDHDRIAEADAASESAFYVGFNMRHSPLYRRLRGLVRDGAVGDLGMISADEVRMPFPFGHYYSRAESGGSLLEKDCHDFDLFNWIVGADPVRVSAFGGQHVLSEGTDAADHATVIVEYENGVKGSLELCLYAPFGHERGRDYSVRGSEGIIRTPEEPGTWELFTRDTHDTFSVTERSGGHGGSDRRQMRHFLRYLRGEGDRTASPTDAKKAAAVALGAHAAIDEGVVVEIDGNYDLRY